MVAGTRDRIKLIGFMLTLMWILECIDALLPGSGLDVFGVHPRSTFGLVGILFAPMLHGGFGHLATNTVPFAVLGFLSTTRHMRDFWRVLILSALTAGLGAWLFGASDSVHIGASGVIFGFLGFLLARGLFEKSLSSILMSGFVAFFFGGMLWAVLPLVQDGISWQSHLFGCLGGVWSARIGAGKGIKRRVRSKRKTR